MGEREQPDCPADMFAGRYQSGRSFDQEQFLGDARYAAVQAGDLDAHQNSRKLQKLRNSTKDFDIHSSFQSSADATAVDNLDGYGSDEDDTLAFNAPPARSLSTPGLHRPLIDLDPMAQFVSKPMHKQSVESQVMTDEQAESRKQSKKEKKRQKKEKKKEKKKSSKKRKRGNSSSSE